MLIKYVFVDETVLGFDKIMLMGMAH